MDDTKLSFDWNHMRAFVATAETGSLSAAARELGQTQPTLGRQVTALETGLGVTLFERIGRTLQITQAGRDLLPHAREMRDSATRLSLIAASQSQSIEGEIRITASDVFCAYLLPEILHKIQAHAPRLRVQLVARNDLADLLRREADIAIRHVRPSEPDLIARMMSDGKGHLYAARSYLESRGYPANLKALSDHDFIGFGDDDQMIEYMKDSGIALTRQNFRTGSENGIVGLELLRSGFGIAPMYDQIAQDEPDIIRVLPDMEPFRFPIWLVTHRELHTSRRIRLVFDMLLEALSQK